MSPLYITRSHAAAVVLALLAAGCGEPAPRALALAVQEMDAPAGPDSGEPYLSAHGDTVLLSWIGRSPSGGRHLRFSRYYDGGWDAAGVVVEPERMLVNVSDFPSVVVGADGALWAHWLERDAVGFGYGIRIVRSTDGGTTWSEPWTPHEDGTPTEHGFVSSFPTAGGLAFVWLDGRSFAATADGSPPRMETALYFRVADEHGPRGPGTPIDRRVCDCCQTDAAVASSGTVVVYRDRSPDEVRDIRVARYVDGVWSDAGLVHDDGWETGACPVNGPAVAARDDEVAVAWFTAAEGEARVHVAFSDDAARSFASPIRVDDGSPAGRVDVLLLDDGSALVSWVERTGGDGAEVRIRRVARGGQRLETASASADRSERIVGFPRLARAGDGVILLAWTDGAELTPRVRVTRIEVEES